MIDLRKDIIRKEIPENENPKKVVKIAENIVEFNKQQKGEGCPAMLDSRPSDLAPVAHGAKASDRKVFGRTRTKILTLKNAPKVTNKTCTSKSR